MTFVDQLTYIRSWRDARGFRRDDVTFWMFARYCIRCAVRDGETPMTAELQAMLDRSDPIFKRPYS